MSRAQNQERRARKICLALPDAVEKTAWGAPTFRTGPGGKIFAMYADIHHGDGHVALWCAALPGTQQILTESDPSRFFVPPYVGKAGWIGVDLDKCPDAIVIDLVTRAYHAIGPPRVRKPAARKKTTRPKRTPHKARRRP